MILLVLFAVLYEGREARLPEFFGFGADKGP
jgi:hypothetical protein